MNIKYRELVEKNTKGVAIVYIDRDRNSKTMFEEDRIVWEPSEKGLALAEGSPLEIEEQKVVMVDSNKNLLGFYLLGAAEGDLRILTPFYTPTFGDFHPPAPKRARSKGHGTKMDKEGFDNYLKNLKEFLV